MAGVQHVVPLPQDMLFMGFNASQMGISQLVNNSYNLQSLLEKNMIQLSRIANHLIWIG